MHVFFYDAIIVFLQDRTEKRVAKLFRVGKIRRSIISSKTCPDIRFLLSFSVPPGKCQDGTTN